MTYTTKKELKPCPFCKTIWIHKTEADTDCKYDYAAYRVNCTCGFAWQTISWKDSEEEALFAWNRSIER